MFSPLSVCLSVRTSMCFFCLSVFEQDISKSRGWIWRKFVGELGYATETKLLDFGEDPDPKL